MTSTTLMKKILFIMIFTLLLAGSIFVPKTLAENTKGTNIDAALSVTYEDTGMKVYLNAFGVETSSLLSVSLQTDTGEYYVLPLTQIDDKLWTARFPISVESATLTAYYEGEEITRTSTTKPTKEKGSRIYEEIERTPEPARANIARARIKDSKGIELRASISLPGEIGVSTDLDLQMPKGIYDLTITPENLAIERIDFNELYVEENIELGLENLKDERFVQAYAIDPTALNFTNATVTVIAQGTTLHKCAEWNFSTQTCYGTWEIYKTGLVIGEQYTFELTPLDPAFGETDEESEPNICIFSDDVGEGDNDQGVNCLAEIIAQNNGFTADMDDLETTGEDSQAIMLVEFINDLNIDTINEVNVTLRYQRETNTEVGDTTATIKILSGGIYTTACTDTLTIGSWETYTCDLSTWITTKEEIDDISLELIIDTAPVGQRKQTGRTYIDYIYLSANYTEQDLLAPNWSTIHTTPTTPTSYTPNTNNSFSITWIDNFAIDTVLIEHNFTGTLQNESMNSIGSTYYYEKQLAAGSYVWRSYANDTSGLVNSSPQYNYEVTKALPDVQLYINSSEENVTYNNTARLYINASAPQGKLELFRETTLINTSQEQVSTLQLFNTIGQHNITLRYNETENYTGQEIQRTITLIDTIPPGIISDLTNQSAGEIWIYWNWTNPSDEDFDHVEIWINNTFKENNTLNYFNESIFNSNTTYEIQIRSVDVNGVKSTFVNNTARTTISSDTTPPIIDNLTHSNITATSIFISWDTNELSSCGIYMGTSSGTYTIHESCDINSLHHETTRTNLEPETTYYYRVSAMDIAYNEVLSPERSFTTLADTTAPKLIALTSTPTSPRTYTEGGLYWFNSTWTDDYRLDEISIEHNFTGTLQNYTLRNESNTYYYNTTINAGTYVWRIYAKDTYNNINKTNQYTYIVNKATPTIELFINGTQNNYSANQDDIFNITGRLVEPSTGQLAMYYSTSLIAQGPTPLEHIRSESNEGIYNITLLYPESDNYLETRTTYWLTIADITPPQVTLLTPEDNHIDTDGDVLIIYQVIDNGPIANCSLILNGTINDTDTNITTQTNIFTKENLSDVSVEWTIRCYDEAGNSGSAPTRIGSVQLNMSMLEIPVTSVGTWEDGTTITLNDINSSNGVAHTNPIIKDVPHYITAVNFTSNNFSPGAKIKEADFYAYHRGTTKVLFEGVKWYNGTEYIEVGCPSVLHTGNYRTDTCDLDAYLTSIEKISNTSLRYHTSSTKTDQLDIDYLYLEIEYIKEATPPIIYHYPNITIDVEESFSQQYYAIDNYGIDYWTINDTQFAVNDTGWISNLSPLSEGDYPLRIRAYDPSNNFAEVTAYVLVRDLVDINISFDTSGSNTMINIYDSSGSLISEDTTKLVDRVLANKLYDLEFQTTLTSGIQKTTLYDVNLSQNINFTSDVTETYSGDLPAYITSISPLFAIDTKGINFSYAEISIPKAGLDIEYISHCTNWNYTDETCSEWDVNETSSYDFNENASHFTINVTSFSAFGGGPGDTLANITNMKLYDVTEEADNRTGGILINSGLSTNYTLGTNKLYRAEFYIENPGKKWTITSEDRATHEGLNNSWTVATTSDIWYTIAGTNYTGGTFLSGTVNWNLSQGGIIDQNENGTWYYVFNTTSLPAKEYTTTFTINDTNINSGSTDTSVYVHAYERELIVNSSSLDFSTTSPIEGQNVTINMTIYNIGLLNATNFLIELWDLSMGVQLYNETINVSSENSTTITYNWTASTGSHLIELRADTPIISNGIIVEAIEHNNNYSRYLNISAWHTIYGSIFEQLVLAGTTNNFYEWPKTDATSANVYAVDADATIIWAKVQALTRDTSNNSASEDFGEADIALGMTGYSDSVTSRFGSDNSTPLTTTSFTIYNKIVENIPVIDSTTTSSFQTGILWDTSDDTGDGEYDGSESLIFMTEASPDTLGTYGTYDYELTLPSALQETEGTNDVTYLYVELT